MHFIRNTISVVVLVSCCAFAANFRAGAAVGGGLTSTVGDSPEFVPSSAGYEGSFSIDGAYAIIPDLSIRTAVGLSYRDFRASRRIAGPEGGLEDEVLSLLYLEVPVYARFKPTQNTVGEAGPVMAFNLLSKYYDIYSEKWFDVKSTNLFQLGFSLGMGLEFSESVELNLRFAYMFMNMFDKDDVGCLSQMIKFQLGFSYWFLK